jgi:sirohydrochlorin cobaltochelatase
VSAPPREAILLFAHGARDPDWAAPFHRIQSRLRKAQPAAIVELCFLELMSPSLPEAVEGLAARGIGLITVVPLFLAQGGHLKRDLPQIVDEIRRKHRQLDISITSAIGDAEELTDAIADWALAQHRAGSSPPGMGRKSESR